jgi:FdhE protein
MKIPARGLTLASLAEEHPEWRAWLGLFEVARAAIDDPGWKAAVPGAPAAADGGAPLIAGATLTIDAAQGATLLAALLEHAGAPAATESVVCAIFEAAITEDTERLETLAAATGAEAARFATVAALAVMPLLQACRQAWQGRIPVDWVAAACPLCGAWATLAEARGLEHQLRLRCGRCGADWAAQVLRCAFCGMTDHERLGTLVADATGDTRKVDTCAACLGYLKTITTLTACPPADVRLLDAATVELDVAALTQGFTRPAAPAHRFEVHVAARAPRGLLAGLARWRR